MRILRSYEVRVNYDMPNAICRAIEEAGLVKVRIGLRPIPLIGSGQVIHKVYEVCLSSKVKNSNLLATLRTELAMNFGTDSAKFADPLTKLRSLYFDPVGVSKRQEIIQFDCGAERWNLVLVKTSLSRSLDIFQANPDGYWTKGVSFQVIANSRLAA